MKKLVYKYIKIIHKGSS